MTLPDCLEPSNARITIPVVLAIAYALYHWLKWRGEAAKGEEEKEPAEEVVGSASGPTNEVSSPAVPLDLRPRPEVEAVKTPVDPEAERLWNEARAIIHSETPDFSTDWHYMTLLYKSAERGSLEAMSKLGDHAYAREDLVEAFYWKLQVEMRGGIPRNPSVSEILQDWLDAGCPEEYENNTVGFPERKGVFARAVLRLRGGVDLQRSRIRLNELLREDDPDARCFLRRNSCET